MAQELQQLLKVDLDNATLHVVAITAANGKGAVNFYLEGNDGVSAAELTQALSSTLIHPYEVRRSSVPGAPEGEKAKGGIVRVFNSAEGDTKDAVLEKADARLAQLSEVGGMQKLADPAITASIKEAIDGYFSGLDGGVVVLKPEPPVTPPPLAAKEPLPESTAKTWTPETKPEGAAATIEAGKAKLRIQR